MPHPENKNLELVARIWQKAKLVVIFADYTPNYAKLVAKTEEFKVERLFIWLWNITNIWNDFDYHFFQSIIKYRSINCTPLLDASSRNNVDQFDNENNEPHVEDTFKQDDQTFPSHENYPRYEQDHLRCSPATTCTRLQLNLNVQFWCGMLLVEFMMLKTVP